MKKKYHQLGAKAALFAAALIWGSSFVVLKNTVDVFPPTLLLAIRFTLGALILSIVFYRKLRLLNKEYFLYGGIIGLCLFSAYFVQTIGLTMTTPGKNAFLTAVYCVLVPFLFWAIDKVKPDLYNCTAAVLCIAGIGLVSLNSGFSVGLGDGLTLVGGVLYALHIILVVKLSKGKDPVLLTILQLGYSGLFAWIIGLLTEQWPAQVGANAIGGLLYLAVFATAACMLFQNIGLKYTHPAAAAIILSLESVFGIIFSVIFYGEQVTPRLLVGFALIFISVITSETKLSFLRKGSKQQLEEPVSKE